MAQRIGPPGSARVAVSGNNRGKPWANVFWVLLGGGASATQAAFDAYIQAFSGVYRDAFQPVFSANVQMQLCQGVLFQSSTTVLHSSRAMTDVGVGGGTPIDNLASAVVLSWLSTAYWRGGKPRTYIPEVKTGDVPDGHALSTAADAFYTNLATSLHAAINGIVVSGISQSQHGFVHFFQGGQLLNPGVFYPITGATVHPRIGTQRRRLGAWQA